jgi:hypothetical protein
VFSALTSLGSITTSTSDPTLLVDVMLGAPLVLGLGFVGPLAPTSGALETFYADLLSGNPTTVLTALIDGPAEIANAYLNGSVGLDVLGVNLPLLNGVLVPDTSLNLDVSLASLVNLLKSIPALDTGILAPVVTLLETISAANPGTDVADISVGPFGGLIDALVNAIPQQILADPPTAGTDLTGLLDPSTLLSGLDLGNLGGLLDPSTLAGDLTTLLPSLASDLPAGLADLGTLIPF